METLKLVNLCATDVLNSSAQCIVKNKKGYINDIFPIVFHDGVVEPASGHAKNVLHTAK